MKRAGALAVLSLAVAIGRVLIAQSPTQPLSQTDNQRESLRPAPSRAQGEGFGIFRKFVMTFGIWTSLLRPTS